MNTLAIIQARMTSKRLPGKVLMSLNGKPVLGNIVDRVLRAKEINKIVVATSTEISDNPIAVWGETAGVDIFRGDLNNVLDRFYQCACQYEPDTIVRLTADNALIDSTIIDVAVKLYKNKKVDYLYYRKGLPLGMCVEVFSFSALIKAFQEATDPECLEHVTPYINRNFEKFKVLYYVDENDIIDNSYMRFTMDSPDDYTFVNQIYSFFGRNDFTYQEILAAIEAHRDWLEINRLTEQSKVQYSGE